MFRTLSLALLLIGVVFITIGYTKMSFECPPPAIQYRYIPRKIYEEQLYDNNILNQFKTMFNNSDPSIRNYDEMNDDLKINDFPINSNNSK